MKQYKRTPLRASLPAIVFTLAMLAMLMFGIFSASAIPGEAGSPDIGELYTGTPGSSSTDAALPGQNSVTSTAVPEHTQYGTGSADAGMSAQEQIENASGRAGVADNDSLSAGRAGVSTGALFGLIAVVAAAVIILVLILFIMPKKRNGDDKT